MRERVRLLLNRFLIISRSDDSSKFGLNQSMNKESGSKLLKPQKLVSPQKLKKPSFTDSGKSFGKLPGLKKPTSYQK